VTSFPFAQVDVFGARPLRGNPLAVVAGADELDTETMQAIARWTDLSETTFLLAPEDPEADYRVRIFTASRELPFAGHPTLGSAHVWRSLGGESQRGGVITQECGAGLVAVRPDGDRLAFAAPPLSRFEPVEEPLLLEIAAGLGLDRAEIVDAAWLVNGPEWIGIRVADAKRVLGLRPDGQALDGYDIGVVGLDGSGKADVEVRAFVFEQGLVEDPVTGSLNAGLAHWLISGGVLPERYVAAPGTVLGAEGRVFVERDAAALWIGGAVTTVVSGAITV
jgi:PhzF family phenazine biosynthesis protein